MSNFVNCPHCQQQLHETAPACPKCGAPNKAVVAESFATYDQVPWYRRRWAVILAAFVFMPIALVIAFSGNVYFLKDGKVQVFPSQFKYSLLMVFAILVLIRMSA